MLKSTCKNPSRMESDMDSSGPITITNPKNKDSVTFLETSASTQGERTLIRVELEPGGSNALHYHTQFRERFEAVEGILTLRTREGYQTLAPGESFTAEPHVEHCFLNPSHHKVCFLTELRPANEKFELFLQVAYGLIRDTWTLPGGFPLNPFALGVLYDLGDTHYRGVLECIEPVASWFSQRARKNGTYHRLLQTYGQTRQLQLHNEE
ncbi:MAG: cupin domain-containing protein [Deltaproteobacteria bacterium]|nr:MAG: cupin domain-containing protein [Deltaproteobacteria bacterium]